MFKTPNVADDGTRPVDLRLSVVAVLFAFCVTAAVSCWNIFLIRDAAVLISRTHDALMATKGILAVLQDAETGQRGYLITNDRDFLTPYTTARANVARELQALDAMGAERLLDPVRVESVHRLVNAKFDELDATLDAHERAGAEAARARVADGKGKHIMDELRMHIAALEEGARALRQDRIGYRQHAVSIALWTTGLLFATGLLVSGLLASLTGRFRRTQLALHEERGRLQATLLSIGDGVIVTDADGVVTTINTVAQALTGWRDDTAIGRPLQEVFVIVNQQTRETVENPALRALREGRIFGLANHTVLIAPNGRETPIDDSAAPIRGADGTPVGAVLVFRDVSTRYAADLALQASELRLRRVIDSMFAFVGILDLDGRLLEANRAPMEASGLQREDVIGKAFWDCGWWTFDPAVQARLKDAFARAFAGESVRYDEYIRVADGGLTAIDLMLRPVEIDGRVAFVIPSGVDINFRKQLEVQLQSALAEAEHRAAEAEQGRRLLDALIEYIPEGVTIADAAGQIQLVSRHGLQIVKRRFNDVNVDLEGQTSAWLIFHSEHGRPAVTSELPLTRAVRSGEEIFNEEWTLQAADGRRVPVLCNAGPIRNAMGQITGGVVVWRDVTEMKRIEARLRDADRRKDEFLATLAHELRNPLAPVRNGLEILRLKHDADAGPVREMITRQVNHMVRLVDDLLDLSRITTGRVVLQRRPFALSEAVRVAVEAVEASVRSAGHRLEIDLGDSPLWVDGDPVRIAQVLSNLLSNAVRYTPSGGCVRLAMKADGAQALIEVADDGIGIPPSMLHSVFEMFAQVNPERAHSRQGLGIGLALVHTLVELHGGSVVAHSDGEGRGTTLSVRLPLVDAPTATLPRAAAPADAQAADICLPVLIVDDNSDSAESLALLLELSGHRTRIAHDGPSALKTAEAFAPRVVLLDIGLPGDDGYAVARQIRAHPTLKQVFLAAVTGWGSEADVSLAHAAGFDVHLTKPVDYERLREILAAVAAGGPSRSG